MGFAASNTLPSSGGTSPFSAFMSQPPGTAIPQQVVQAQDGSLVPIGLLASQNSSATSTNPWTTRSYMRDLMGALATIGSLSSAQTGNTNFMPLVQDTMTTLNDVVGAMATDAGVLGNRQSALTAMQTQLSDTATALTGQVSAVQDADMTTTLSRLTAVQTQLQMSYRMIVSEGTLSLSSYLPAG
jgi:flagellin-like hook-associated protein FlgL